MPYNNLPQGNDNPTITVPIPPQRLRWLMSQLDAAGIPFDLDAAGNLTTLEAGQPIIDQVLGYQAQRPQSGARGGFDLLSHQPQNRSFGTDAIGFMAALTVIYGVVSQSARVSPLAAGLGFDPLLSRSAAVMVGGLVATLLISEFAIGRGDRRRGLFVFGMMCGFAVAALYFACKAWGIL